MNYQEALNYIHGRPRSVAAAPTLARISSLMAMLGDPQNRLKFVHIAGTNGKGSVAAMTASVMQVAGMKTGMYTSPFLEVFEERIQCDGRLIPREELCGVVEKVKAAEDRRLAEGLDPVNEFELVTAAAFVYFQSRGCDIVVLETGLGGMFDPTNIIAPPEVAVITHIAKDHTAILGNELRTIAGQKAGIIKSGSSVVIAPNEPEVIQVLRDRCSSVGVVPRIVDKSQFTHTAVDAQGCRFETERGLTVSCPLLGYHQLTNAMTAFAAIDALRKRGFEITDRHILQGFSTVSWPGRLEMLSRQPAILLDSAHNPDGASALAAALDGLFSGKEVTAVIGMMADKDWKTCIDILAPRCERIIASSSDMERSLSPWQLAQYAGKYCSATAAPTLKQAIETGIDTVSPDGVLLICGSVIMAGQARTIVKGHI